MRSVAVLAREGARRDLAELPRRICEAGLDVWLVPHPYHLPEDSDLWRELRDRKGASVFLLPLHPRPIEALARRHGAWKPGSQAFDLRACENPDALVARLGNPGGKFHGPGKIRTLDAPPGRRWYPLMDESRCANCGCCLQFCLFGVYERDPKGNVRVAHPDRCKPGCPACSRICPQGALIFPLYEKDPAIAGAPGRFPQPDAAARKMYYSRTGLACPRCGRRGKPEPKAGGPACEECGRPAAAPGGQPDELDTLLDGLERLQEGPR